MQAYFKDLVGILEKEQAILVNLEQLLQGEKDCLQKFDREGLDRCNSEVENLTIQMDILEQSRKGIIKKLAVDFQIEVKDATLARLAMFADKHWSMKLIELRDAIVKSSGNVHKLQESNKILLINGMKIIHGLSNVVSETVSPQLTYTAKGNQMDRSSSGISGRRI